MKSQPLLFILLLCAILVTSSSTASAAVASTPLVSSTAVADTAVMNTKKTSKNTKRSKKVRLKTRNLVGTAKTSTGLTFKYSLLRFQLKGSTKKARRAVKKSSKNLVRNLKRNFSAAITDYCSGLDLEGTPSISMAKPRTSVYRSRYASVFAEVSAWSACTGTPANFIGSFTIDLKTGKKVSLKKFVKMSDPVNQWVFSHAAASKYAECGWNAASPLTGHTGWQVSKKGLTLGYFRYALGAGYCEASPVTVPWSNLLRTGRDRGKTHTRVFTSHLQRNPLTGGYDGNYLMVTVRGSRAYVFDGLIDSHAYCSIGIRKPKLLNLYSDRYGSPWQLQIKGKDAKFRIAHSQETYRSVTKAEHKWLLRSFNASYGIKALNAKTMCEMVGSSQG